MNRRPKTLVLTSACAVALSLTACGASSPPDAGNPPASSAATTSEAAAPTPSVSTSSTPATTPPPTRSGTTSAAPSTSAAGTSTSATSAPPATPTSTASRNTAGGSTIAYRDRPVIVIDPGHSPTVHKIDNKTGLNVSDYENEPEMRDVFKVALLVRADLKKAGYRVVMTKNTVDQREDLAARAYLANRVHAALAISIHDQAGANGGIGFRQGNNTVYYQSVGTYRATPSGKRIYFRNKHLAATSEKYGKFFRRARANAQHNHINLQGNVGYNLGSRGLAAGNIWIVQLLSKVPWIYNEAGGNSAGRVGLDSADRGTYARGLVAGIEKCVPVRKN